MNDSVSVPDYVYRLENGENSLFQGDILKVNSKLHKFFKDFYPEIRVELNSYLMILTQSCDLVKNSSRKPKLSHFNVCVMKTLRHVLDKYIEDELNPFHKDKKKICVQDAYDRIQDRFSKLLNNSDQKIFFYLPKKNPLPEDMVAQLNLSFSFRATHYDAFIGARVLGLKSEFQAKVGHIISQLYGRVGTQDLLDFNWDDKKVRNYINDLLKGADLISVPDENHINYIKNSEDQNKEIDDLIEEYETQKVKKDFSPIKNKLIQDIRNKLIQIFENPDEITRLQSMEKKDLSKNIREILNQAME